MQAVIRTGGKQYYVAPGDILEVDRIAGNIGDTIQLEDVLMVAGDDDVAVGQPIVSDAAVAAKITGQYRGKKIQVFRYRPKKRIRVRRGHRQYLTRLEIQSITWGDQEFAVPAPAPAPEPEVEEPVVMEDASVKTAGEEVVDAEPIVAETTAETVVEAENDTPVADDADDSATADVDADKSDADEKKE